MARQPNTFEDLLPEIPLILRALSQVIHLPYYGYVFKGHALFRPDFSCFSADAVAADIVRGANLWVHCRVPHEG